jgi:hypothetical protein
MAQHKPAEDTRTQRQKFIDLAREHEVDETGKESERAFNKVAKPLKPTRKSSSRGGA